MSKRFFVTGYKRITILLLMAVVCAAFAKKHEPKPYCFVLPKLFPSMPVNGHNPVTVEGAELGRYLFYDPILSERQNLACASCHRQQHAFSDAPNVFSRGYNGALMDRNTLPLFNLAWHPSLFWDGRAASIEEQVFHPVRAHNEMNMPWPLAVQRIKSSNFYREKFYAAFGSYQIDSTTIARAIAQFERTLVSCSSRYDSVLQGKAYFTKDEFEGFEIVNDMTKGDCLHCHTTDSDPLGTTFAFSNNGLDAIAIATGFKDKGRGRVTGDSNDNGKFKIPTLRNLFFTAPYMHDGRFKTLEEVLDFYSEGVHTSANVDSKMGMAYQHGVHLTQEEKRKVLIFLKTMTDSAFITAPAFSTPFAQGSKNRMD